LHDGGRSATCAAVGEFVHGRLQQSRRRRRAPAHFDAMVFERGPGNDHLRPEGALRSACRSLGLAGGRGAEQSEEFTASIIRVEHGQPARAMAKLSLQRHAAPLRISISSR
jgi:hypothetical protein